MGAMIHFANPLHNTVAVGIGVNAGCTATFRRYAGETWDEAMARLAWPGCTAAWVRERWDVMRIHKLGVENRKEST